MFELLNTLLRTCLLTEDFISFLAIVNFLRLEGLPQQRGRRELRYFFATWVFSPKKFHFCLKKILRGKIREQSDKNRGWESRTSCITRTLIFAWNRLQFRIHAPQGIPELLCVCPPRRAPGGNTRHRGVHCVSSCFCSLLVFGPEIF